MLTTREPYNTTTGMKTWNKIKQVLPTFRQQRKLVPVYVRTGKTLRFNRVNHLSKVRTLLQSITFVAVVTMYIAAEPALAQDHKNALTAEDQAEITPAEALDMLKEGNKRFVKDKMVNRDLMKQVSQTATGQYPHAVVLGCIDSRVPPELVFDQGIGDIFAPRIAGNFVNKDILGSMEFATKVAGSKLIVVLGHSSCGAVKGACDNVELGNLTHTLKNLMPAVHGVEEVIGDRNSKNAKFVEDVAHLNVKLTVNNILEQSPIMKELVDQGELMVVGAIHDVSTGRVTFMN
ncbi:MAG: hypothetical protein KTR29_10005 [Rhodothermaceae bacterium]|nr:hypothetical protein [Rhodothermaceae bacterium]